MLSVDGIPSENGIFQEVSQEVKNLQEDIKTGKFKNAYLLFGEEAYLKIQYKEKLIHALNPDDDTMNFTKYEGKGIEVREMIDLCETMPFFADHRVVLVENSGFFKNKCDELADYMKTLPDYLRLVFVEEEVDKRSRMYKAVKNCGRIVEFAKQDEKTLMRWAGRYSGERRTQDHDQRYGTFSDKNRYGYGKYPYGTGEADHIYHGTGYCNERRY